MSLLPDTICRQCYARIGAFRGDADAIATAYTGPLSGGLNTESFPLQTMYDMLVGIENEMGTSVASNKENVLRSVLQDVATVTSGNRIPAIGDAGGKIIGVWGQVIDADSGIELTPALHEDEIRAVVNAAGLFKSSLYSYVLQPPRIYATTTNLTIDVCTFNYATRAAAINANEALLFDQMQNAYFSGLMASLKNEDANYTALANEYVPQYQAWLAAQRPAMGAAA